MSYLKSSLHQSFYSGNFILQLSDWEYIIRSIITHSKTIWVRNSIIFAPNIPFEIKQHIEKVKEELVELGVIKSWELEITNLIKPKIERVITYEEQKDLYKMIYSDLSILPTSPLIFNNYSIDRIAKNVDLKKYLWDIGIANYCGYSNMLYNNYNKLFQNLIPNEKEIKFSLISKYISKIFEKFAIINLWKLNVEEIIKFQKTSYLFQNEIIQIIKNEFNISSEDIEKRVELLANEYDAIITELVRNNFMSRFILQKKLELFNTIELFIPVISFLPFSNQLFRWVKEKNNLGFMMYMYELKTSI